MVADQVIAGRFDLVGVAGRGGMATVYRARDRTTGDEVALKVIDATPDTTKRFVREASAIEGMTHPCIVRYRDRGELEDGRVFLAMEWIEGISLGTYIRAGRIPLPAVLVMCSKLAHALAAVHARGLVHRDVKPGNVMLRDDDVMSPVLLDFGLVKPVVGDEITSVGIACGTPGYMSPEQARGSSRVDARADIFALGCMLFRCVTGQRPFDGVDVNALLVKLLFDATPSMKRLEPRASSELDDLVGAMLAKDPDDRPSDVTIVASALERLAQREAPSQPRRTDPTMLTFDEQRPVSVVVVAEVLALDGPTLVAPLEESEALLRPVESPIARADLTELAESLGGVAETLANGTLVVVFTGSTNARDQCARAARCALRLLALVPNKMVALASGRAHSQGGSIVGEAIDRAVLMLREPFGEGVKVGPSSLQLLEPRFEVNRHGEELWLTAERADALAVRTLVGAATPCVGRDSELVVVATTLAQCIEENVARVVAVTADAGIGKSRIASEVVSRAASTHPTLTIWQARGDPQFERSPLSLVGRMIRELARVQASDAAAARCAQLRARVAEHVPADDVATTAEFLGEMCGVPFDDEGRPALHAARRDPVLMANQMRAAFDRFIAAEVATAPLMIVVEDLHWADAVSVSYLERALTNLDASPLLVFVLSRPEGKDRFSTLFAVANHLHLHPLSPKAATKLARAVLGAEIASATIDRLVELAAGNVFYLEELIRAVAERQTTSELPETVVLMTQARLQALDPEARRVLRAASLFGAAFTAEDIAALDDDRQAAQWLVSLVDAEVLTKLEGNSYSFRHALLREAAYASLTDEDRVLGHKLAARRLVSRGDGDAMAIAEHYRRGADLDAAITAYLRAAEQALDAGDFEAPELALERARACGAAGSVLGRFEGLATRAAWLRGDMAASERLGRAAIEKLTPGELAWYEVIADLANALQGRLDHAGIEELAHRLLREPPPARITAAYARALTLFYTLVVQSAPTAPLTRELSRTVDAVDGAGDPLVEARLAIARAFGAASSRDPRAAELFAAAARNFEEVGNYEVARIQRNSHALALGWLGAWEESASVASSITAAAGRAWLWSRVTLGWSLAQLGRVDEAMKILEPVIAAGGDDSYLVVETEYAIARIDILRGSNHEACVRAAAALADESLPKATVARLHAVAYDAGGEEAHGRAVADALEGGVSFIEDAVYVRLIAARFYQRSNDLDRARALAAEARQMIMEYAEKIHEPASRERYLGCVQENVRVLDLVRELS